MLYRILLVCYGNTCRSAMLRPILQREMCDQRVLAIVSSAGVKQREKGVFEPASAHALEVMQEININLRDHQAMFVGNIKNPGKYTHVFCFREKYVEAVIEMGFAGEKVRPLKFRGEDIPNPHEKGIDAYRQTRDILGVVAEEVAREILFGMKK